MARIKIGNLYKAQTELGDLSKDMLVWSFDGIAIKPACIKRDGVSDSGQKPVLELRLRDGSRIVATADHKIMTSRGWVQMADLDPRHLVMTATGFLSPRGMPTPAGTAPTFDITCEADPNFVANGIVVHNSGKGFIVALLARMYSRHRVLCLFNSVDLVLQTRDALVNKYGFGDSDVGVVQGQNFQDDRRVTVMSVASYEKAFHMFPSQRVIVVDECFPGRTKVVIGDGSRRTIASLVREKFSGTVRCFDPASRSFVERPISAWFKRTADSLVTLHFGADRQHMTPNHKVYVMRDGGMVQTRADEIVPGDECVFDAATGVTPPCLSKAQRSAAIGITLGDGNISALSNTARLKLVHSVNQMDYLRYKMTVFSNMISAESSIQRGGYSESSRIAYVATRNSLDFLKIHKMMYVGGAKRAIHALAEVDDIAMAFWFMDDGHYCESNGGATLATHSFPAEDTHAIAEFLCEKFRVKCKVAEDKRIGKHFVILSPIGTDEFFGRIAPYIPPSMQYKLPPDLRGRFVGTQVFEDARPQFGSRLVTNVETTSKKTVVYNVTVDDVHNYLVGRGLLVANCHELASGTGAEMSTRVLYACQNAPVRIGLSATADAIDNPYRQMALYGNLGPIVYDEHIQDKVAEGTLADIDVEMHQVGGFVVPVTGNWADSYEEARIESKAQRRRAEELGLEIVTKKGEEYARRMTARGDESTHYVFNDRRNDLIARLALEHGRTVILYTRREHGEQLLRRIEDGGGRAMLIGGMDDARTRKQAQEFLLEDERHIVLASNIWKKGTDVPWIHTLIIAGAGRGTAMVIQRFGRATRKDKKTSKDRAKVIDFIDSFSKMGAKQSARRMEIYRDKLGFGVKVV